MSVIGTSRRRGLWALAMVMAVLIAVPMMLLAVPLVLLYEFSLVAIWFTERRRAREADKAAA